MIADGELRRLGLGASAVRLWGPLIRTALIAAVLAVIAAQSVVCWKIAATTWHGRRMADFGVFYDSAARARTGGDPYALAPAGDGRLRRPPNLTPPHVVAALVPVSLLPPAAALAIWATASIVSAILALAVVFREAGIRARARPMLLAAAAIVCAAPTGALIFSAQITWLLWWPAARAWADARHGRWTAAAAILGALASVKLFLGLFGVMFLLLRMWRPAAVLFGTAAACLAAGWIALGHDAFAGWIEALRAVSWAGHVWNGSLLGIAQRALLGSPHTAWPMTPFADAPDLVLPVWAALAAAILFVTAHAVRRPALPTTSLDTDRLFALTLTAAMLLSPLGWMYYDFLLVAPFVALAASPSWRTGARVALVSFAGAALMPTPGMLAALQPNGVATITIGSLYGWAVVAAWLASVTSGAHSARPAAPVH